MQRLYLTGALVGEQAATIDYLTMNQAAVGTGSTHGWPSGTSATQHFFAGSIDEVAVYPSALSAERISAHYSAGLTPAAACANTVPITRTSYDEGIKGLAATYWNNMHLTGPPVGHGTGMTPADGSLHGDWPGSPAAGVNADQWSARWTGYINLDKLGTYSFTLAGDDAARIWIDDQYVAGGWHGTGIYGGPTGTFTNTAPGWKRIRIEYFEINLTATFDVAWTPPGGARTTIPGSVVLPGYGLVTSTTTEDSGGAAPSQTSATVYADPYLGVPTETIDDPNGLNLRNRTGYETQGAGYLRRTSRTLPAGTSDAYAYYGDKETRDIPCPGAATGVNQGGMLKTSAGPAAADGSRVITEIVYDASMRPAATRTNVGDWTCTTYDARGRATKVTHPAANGFPAREVTSDNSVGGNPLVSSVTDPAGTITTEIDLLGRVVSYTDVHGLVTTTEYDQVGRVFETTTTPVVGAVSKQTFGYDAAGKLEWHKLDDKVIADPAYDPASGELLSVAYPAGTGNAGNGTALGAVARDGQGRLQQLDWTLAGGTQLIDAVTRARSGSVLTDTVSLGGTVQAQSAYGYDAAGRLTTAQVGRLVSGAMKTHQQTYGFGPASGCGDLTGSVPDPGLNGNRTSLVDVFGATTTTTAYCYDAADRLLRAATTVNGAAPTTINPTYDTSGNTTAFADQSLGYDAVNRHLSTVAAAGDPPRTITYTRDATDRIVARTAAPAGGLRRGQRPLRAHRRRRHRRLHPRLGPAAVLERSISLPGGVLYTWRPDAAHRSVLPQHPRRPHRPSRPHRHPDRCRSPSTTHSANRSTRPPENSAPTPPTTPSPTPTPPNSTTAGSANTNAPTNTSPPSPPSKWAPANTSQPSADSYPSTPSKAAAANDYSTTYSATQLTQLTLVVGRQTAANCCRRSMHCVMSLSDATRNFARTNFGFQCMARIP